MHSIMRFIAFIAASKLFTLLKGLAITVIRTTRLSACNETKALKRHRNIELK